jgi:methionyl-tRNA formyltransferase
MNKKIRLALIGSGKTTNEVSMMLIDSMDIELVGIVPDRRAAIEVRDLQTSLLLDWNIDLIEFSDFDELKLDMAVAIEYRSIISKDIVDAHWIINFHMGLLPKYRGFNSNASALLNNEECIGYTIHRMTEKFDDGPIYITKKFMISLQQTYSDLAPLIYRDLTGSFTKNIVGIFNQSFIPVEQKPITICYGTRITPTMGNISGFNYSTANILNLFRVFALPIGSGVYFYKKRIKYTIVSISSGRNNGILDYVGFPGKVVNIDDNGIYIKTKDNIVLVHALIDENNDQVEIQKKFKIGDSL